MKTSNMNLTLLTTNSKATKRWGAEEGLIIITALLAYLQTLPHITSTCNLSDLKLVGYKIIRGSRIFFGGGGGVMMDNAFFF